MEVHLAEDYPFATNRACADSPQKDDIRHIGQ
jgi:hypothetical protein